MKADRDIINLSKNFRKTIGFVGSIEIAKALEGYSNKDIFEIANKYKLNYETIVTGKCPSDGGLEGYTIFKNVKNGRSFELNFDCAGYYI